MEKLVLKKCNHCGNILSILIENKCEITCCEHEMETLIAKSADAATEKHVPIVTIKDNLVEVVVGSTEHPMTDEHHIAFIYLETKNGGQIKYLNHSDKPMASFVLGDDKVIRVFEYCNLHGLWVCEI